MIKKYQFYSLPKHWKYMFILQNPKEDKKELQKVLKRKTWKGRIGSYRTSFKYWIKSDRPEFFDKFLRTVGKSTNGFFKEFYITDCYKKDKSKWEGGKKGKEERRDMEDILKNEIFHCKPTIIFLFGGMAWEFFKKNAREYNLNTKDKKNLKKTIKDAHGHLFWFKLNKNNSDIYLIPLIHFSGSAYNSAPRESYHDYLEEGFTQYKKRARN